MSSTGVARAAYDSTIVELLSGVVTLLFTDIEGSTQLLKRLGDAYGETLEQHRRFVRSAIEHHGGIELGTEGDSFFVVFSTAAAGMAAALEAQRALSLHPWQADSVVRVRMGLHTGSVARSGDHYIGMAVHEAARISAAAHGGQIVVSEATANGGRPPLGATLRSLGAHRLKDIDNEVRILQLCHPELQDEFPALRSATPPAGALPSFASSFVGRAAERDELATLVRKHRLLTIVGPPGVGKTRLAIELGRDFAAERRAGVRIVEVATVHSGVAEQVARGLGVAPQGDQPPEAALVQYLASSDSLLIIDNCEHVIAEVAALAHQIMSGCPQVRLVLTSREPLEVVGETVWQLSPLREAAALFVERAQAAAPGIALRPDDQDVMAICSELDALPLGIELAAAQVRRRSIGEIARDLADPSSFLDRSSRSATDRHATLRAAVSWSYQLLAPSEAALLDHLAVFTGSFDAAAAAAVAGTPTAQDDLERLVDQSLVSVDWDAERRRYHVLATIRAYAAAQLEASGERAAAAAAHARHFRGARARVPEGEWWYNDLAPVEELARDLANHRAALTWYLAHDPSEGLAYATDLDVLWYLRLAPRDGTETIEQFLAVAREGTDSARVSALAILADLHRRRGRFDDARSYAEGAIAIDVRAGRDRGIVSARVVLAQILAMQGDTNAARLVFEEDFEQARAEGDEREMVTARRGLISLALERGDADTARAVLVEAQEQAARLNLRFMSVILLGDSAHLALLDGDLAQARSRLQDVLAFAQGSGNANATAEISLKLARVARHAGEIDEALELLTEAARVFSAEGDDGGVAHVLTERGVIASHTGDYVHAAVLLGGARAVRDRLGIATPGSEADDVDDARQAAAAVLGADELARSWLEGQHSSVESLVAAVGPGT
jgi:predicted ATPase/class 3 adenylate cyclase